MLNQFSRTQLLLGEEGMEKLFRARVAVFGIGGVGGYTVEALHICGPEIRTDSGRRPDCRLYLRRKGFHADGKADAGTAPAQQGPV